MLKITAGNSNISYVEFADPDDADTGEIRYNHATNYMGFHTNGNVERMRIDTSTNVASDATGNQFTYDGSADYLAVKRENASSSAAVAYFNRTGGYDGDIVTFRKDGTTVGSIGVAQSGDRTYFSGGSYGIASDTSQATIMPCNTTGGGNNGVVSLGKSDARFKDGHFSGTVNAASFSGDGSSLTGIASVAGGGGSDEIFWENGQNVTTNYTKCNVCWTNYGKLWCHCNGWCWRNMDGGIT